MTSFLSVLFGSAISLFTIEALRRNGVFGYQIFTVKDCDNTKNVQIRDMFFCSVMYHRLMKDPMISFCPMKILKEKIVPSTKPPFVKKGTVDVTKRCYS